MKAKGVSGKYIKEVLRFDGSYHLSDGTLYLQKMKSMPYVELKSLASEIFTSGRSKRVYTSKERGYPYLSNSDVSRNNPFNSCSYNSKKYGYDESAFLKEGMIVTGRVGAIGQTSYISSEFEEKEAMGSDNIIRIVSNEKEISGYLYSFLASKYGNTLLNRLAAGGVQPYISDKMLWDMPVPLLPKEKQAEIHQLIVDAAELRVEANRLLEEAVNAFKQFKINYESGKFEIKKIVINNVLKDQKRFDANFNILNDDLNSIKEKNKIRFIKISELASDVFIGPRSRRNYVENGVPFLSTSEMQKANPTKTEKAISKTSANEFLVKEGWLLTTRSGTLGDTVFTLPCMNDYAVTEDAIRIVLNDNSELSNFYVFAFLKSDLGKNSLLSGSYGSVILHLNEEYVRKIQVPVLEKEEISRVNLNVSIYVKNINAAISKENQAISLIEKEIDLWQN